MSDDLFEQTFSGLDPYYPGSKRKRQEPKVSAVKQKAAWDSKPSIKTLPNGKDVEMFTLGALADALGRPIITLRAWMNAGYLPTSPYRLPSKLDKNGKERQGRRLYTRPMIEAAVAVFTRAGLLKAKRVEWSLHRQVFRDIDEAWGKIRANENDINDNNGE